MLPTMVARSSSLAKWLKVGVRARVKVRARVRVRAKVRVRARVRVGARVRARARVRVRARARECNTSFFFPPLVLENVMNLLRAASTNCKYS